MDIELIAAQHRLDIHSTYKNHVICKDTHDYAIKAWIN